VTWGRLSRHPAFDSDDRERRRVRPTRVAPISIFLRQDAAWLLHGAETLPAESLSHPAREILEQLSSRGASFFSDLVRATGRLASEVEDGLWELVAAGLVTADGFENLRALIDPKRRRGEGSGRTARPRHAPGRWALLPRVQTAAPDNAYARQLLARWGVLFRDLLARETMAPPWRDLLQVLRRMEARGEIRGGRFTAGFIGDQFALPEALDLLRAVRRSHSGEEIAVAAADPLNLAGIILPGGRVSALSGETLALV
jgi:ATP-dependent Lhr-like helicase